MQSVAKEHNQQVFKELLKSLGRKNARPEAVRRMAECCVQPDRSAEEILEEMVACVLAARDMGKHGLLPPRFPLSHLIEALREVAEKNRIRPEKFYAAVLEAVVSEADDGSRAGSRHSSKDKILDAALEVFSEKGFHLATVDEIAERADVGKGTLYRYFANKETLFNELVRLRLEELERNATAVLDGQDDVLTMITKYLRIYFEFFDRNQHLYRLIVQERLDVGGQVQDLYFKKVMRRIPLLKRKIYGASQQGVLKDVDFQTVFYGVMGFVHGVIQKWLARDCSYSLVEELPGVVEVLFYGFVNRSNVDLQMKCIDQEETNG